MNWGDFTQALFPPVSREHSMGISEHPSLPNPPWDPPTFSSGEDQQKQEFQKAREQWRRCLCSAVSRSLPQERILNPPRRISDLPEPPVCPPAPVLL